MADGRADRAYDRSIHTAGPEDGETRVERDALGSLSVPREAYWGINVGRALENFAITGRPISSYPDLLYGFACVKQAAARANAEIGALDPAKADLIDRACEDVKDGRLRDQFVVDVMQGGAGTSTNMNFNEVLANRGLELAGHPRGAYAHLDPNDDVNCGQSTNDTYPTAVKVGLCLAIERLLVALTRLEDAFHDRARHFRGVLKVGRTQLQDAVPMTLEQEFESFAVAVRSDRIAFSALIPRLGVCNLGGTAIGTGIAADPRYADAVRRHLAEITGLGIVTAPNLVAATTDVDAFVDVSATLKRSALKLSKIANDLRLASSGPQAGLHEIDLPPVQAGSSIMPGKVNPVVPECVNQVAFAVVGGDVTVGMAAEAGQLQLNAFGPVIAHVLFENLKAWTAAVTTLRERCVTGITANEPHLRRQMRSFVGVVTALIPHIGYAKAAELARRALAGDDDVADTVVASGALTREQAAELLAPERLTSNRAGPLPARRRD